MSLLGSFPSMGIDNGDHDAGTSNWTPVQLVLRNGLKGGEYSFKL